MVPLLAALAGYPAIEEEPFLRTYYLRAAFGMSTLNLSGEVRAPGAPARTVSARGIFALAMDARAGVVVGKAVVVGLALNTTSSGATIENGTSRESAMVMFHVLGPFVAVYPAPRVAGVHIGTTLGYAIGVGGDVTGTGPGLTGFLGFDTRGEQMSVHAFDFRLAWSPWLRGTDSRATAFAFGFQYSIGWR